MSRNTLATIFSGKSNVTVDKRAVVQKTVETHMKLALDYFKKIFESRIPNRLISLLMLFYIG